MEEVEFIESIDGCFPYDDEKEWHAVIDRAIAISDNCAYMVLFEISIAPEVSVSELLRMLEYWSSRYNHPSKDMVLRAAMATMLDVTLPEEDVLRCLEALSSYSGLYNAAHVMYGVAPEDCEKAKGRYLELLKGWGYDVRDLDGMSL